MTVDARMLTGRIQVRMLQQADAARLKAAYQLNRDYLAPWEPLRSDEFFTDEGQAASVAGKLNQYAEGSMFPWVLLEDDRIVGTITLNDIVRGPFLNAHVSYWVDEEYSGQGIGSSALAFVIETATKEIGLHRLQAATLCHNIPSQKILKRTGFAEIGAAASYLNIAGKWQDHVLYQRILY